MAGTPTYRHARATERRRRVARWVLLVRAVVVMSVGLAFLLSGVNRPVLGNLLATYWLAGALLTIGWVRANRGKPGSRLALTGGIAGVIAAIIGLTRLLIEQVVSVDAVLALVGVSAIVIGVLRLAGAVRDDPRPFTTATRRVLLGLSEVGIGVIAIVADEVTRTMTNAAGIWALVGGTIMLFDARYVRTSSDDERTG